MIDWGLVADSIPLFLQGLRTTLLLMLGSLAAGFVLALPLAVARVSPRRWLAGPVWLYTYVIRGTPLLVQLFVIYYGLAQFEWLRAPRSSPARSRPRRQARPRRRARSACRRCRCTRAS